MSSKNYQPTYSNTELLEFQNHHRLSWATKEKDLPNSVTKKHLNNFYNYLTTSLQIHHPVELTLYGRGQLPHRVIGESVNHLSGIAHTERYADGSMKSELHVAYKDRTLFSSMVTLAHEYRHSYQILVQNRWDDKEHDLECDAIDYSYDVVTDYLKTQFLNE